VAAGAPEPGDRFVLAFGGDEFNHATLRLAELTHVAVFQAPVVVEGDGWSTLTFEFRLEGGALSLKDAGTVIGRVLVSIRGQPGELPGQAAKVWAHHPATGALLPVGRALLWRPDDFEAWRLASGR
jgi:hypothetical protein